jgi:hypothetical protein
MAKGLHDPHDHGLLSGKTILFCVHVPRVADRAPPGRKAASSRNAAEDGGGLSNADKLGSTPRVAKCETMYH